MKQGHRAQIDRDLYKQHLQKLVQKMDNLELEEGTAEDLITSQEGCCHDTWRCDGVVTGKLEMMQECYHKLMTNFW